MVKKKNVITLFCKHCRVDREMKRTNKDVEGNIIWLRCSECGTRTFISEDEYNELTSNGSKAAASEEVEYNPSESFSIGQALYHKVWDDRGEVIKKETTNSGNHMIVVSFDRLGKRRLVESLNSA